MNLPSVQSISKATELIDKATKFIKTNQNTILRAMGVVGVGLGFGTAIKATTKAVDIVDEAKDELDRLESLSEKTPEIEKQIKHVKLTTIGKLAKTYAVPLGTTAGGVFCFLSANNNLKKEAAYWSSTAAGTMAAFTEYRENTRNRFGNDVDRELLYGLTKDEEAKEVVDENGVVHKLEKAPIVKSQKNFSNFCYKFTMANPNWVKGMPYDYTFAWLHAQEQYLNDLLSINREEVITLNQALDSVGLPLSKKGHDYGWVRGETVSFGIDWDNLNKNILVDFSGGEPYIALDFFGVRPEINEWFPGGKYRAKD